MRIFFIQTQKETWMLNQMERCSSSLSLSFISCEKDRWVLDKFVQGSEGLMSVLEHVS